MDMETDKITLADHAEAWHRENGRRMPDRDTAEWKRMYGKWIEHAFKGFGRKKAVKYLYLRCPSCEAVTVYPDDDKMVMCRGCGGWWMYSQKDVRGVLR